MTNTPLLESVLRRLDDQRGAAVERLREFLTIPSVSTDPAYAGDVRRAAEWTARRLREVGLATQVHDTAGHPVVVGRTMASRPGPSIVFYGHYDVQPADPLALWQSPPFEPVVRDGWIYARGACDDKGQVSCFLEALRAWHEAAGSLPANLTVVLEGEEECGSTNLPRFLEQHRDQLPHDPRQAVVLISDTSMWRSAGNSEPTVAITYGLRGLLYMEVQLHGPARDLHSGMYGGILANPATLLARALGRLFDENNRVTIPGFYDDVAEPAAEERARWAKLGFDEQAYLGSAGVTEPFGEAGFTTLERKWTRPSCDINGLYGGYAGKGAKTVIPSFAGAKVSFRLAPRQDPAKIEGQFREWLQTQDVGGCRWKIENFGRADAVMAPVDSPFLSAAAGAIRRTTGREPALIREGATIPVVADFKKILGLDSLLIGFGLEDDCIHSPNERFDLDRFHLGCRTHAAVLDALGRL